MKSKRIIVLFSLLFVLTMSVGVAFAATKTERNKMDVGYKTVPAYSYAYYKSGVLYDCVKANFYFEDKNCNADDDLLNTRLVITAKKLRNGAALRTTCYSNSTPKPSETNNVQWAYSDNWAYRANGLKLVVQTESYSATGTAITNVYTIETK